MRRRHDKCISGKSTVFSEITQACNCSNAQVLLVMHRYPNFCDLQRFFIRNPVKEDLIRTRTQRCLTAFTLMMLKNKALKYFFHIV